MRVLMYIYMPINKYNYHQQHLGTIMTAISWSLTASVDSPCQAALKHDHVTMYISIPLSSLLHDSKYIAVKQCATTGTYQS